MRGRLGIVLFVSLVFGLVPVEAQVTPTTKPALDTTPFDPSTQPVIPAPTAPLPPNMTRIFDGKSLEGWAQLPPGGWTVRNDAIASLGAGRGVIYTTKAYGRYRVIFDIRHIGGKPDHQAAVLVFCATPATDGSKPPDALAGIQFQVPNGGSWDYRKGKNNAGKGLFTRNTHDKFDIHQWSRCEILVDPTTGTARMAVAQPPGSKAFELLDFKDPAAGQSGPFSLQMHNKGLYDEFANIAIEENPSSDELITTRDPAR